MQRETRHPHTQGMALILAVSLILAGCATSPRYDAGYGPLSPAERRLRRQSSDTARTNTQACLAGGAAVGLATLLLSQNRRNKGQRALVGALAGCGVGMGVNTYVQGQRRQYAYKEQRLNDTINDVRRDNARVSRVIATAEEVIAADRQRIARADRAYRQRDISLAQARRELRTVKENRNHLTRTLSSLKKKQQKWERIAEEARYSGADTRVLDVEIERLEEQISELEDELHLIDQQIRVSPISA